MMTSANEPFRNANPTKRKLNDPTTSFESLASKKSVKFTNGSSPHDSGIRTNIDSSKRASVQNEQDEADNDDIEAGPTAPEDEEEDADEIEEDEEGRFFGGGVSKHERDVMNFVDQNEAGDVEEVIDLVWLKRTTLNFERKINKNAELRAKYEDDPMKFVSSEADLDTEIKGLSILSEHPDLYQDFARSGCVGSLVGLLAHDNTDIAISICEVIAELTDEDSGAEDDQWNTLVKALLKADVTDLLVSNLQRLDEGNENDSSGVYHILNVLENLLSDKANSDQLGTNSRLLKWLLFRIEKPDHEARGKVGQNRQYAAEILAIILQNSDTSISASTKIGLVDILLQQVSNWRKHDPGKDSDEEAFAENLFDCLISVVRNVMGRTGFVEGEGIELCIIMLKEGKFSKRAALRLLDHAAGTPGALTVNERIVDAGGLKSLFTMFMKSKKEEPEVVEHLLGLFASMLKSLTADTAARIRLLAKFVEKDYEKIGKLIELRAEYVMRVNSVKSAFRKELNTRRDSTKEELEDELLSRQMDAGLFSVQTIDVILAWLVAEDAGARQKIVSALKSEGGLNTIKQSLMEQLTGMTNEDQEATIQSREVLQALIECLQ